MKRIGVDIGGTEIKGAVVEDNGAILGEIVRRTTRAQAGRDAIEEGLSEVVAQLFTQSGAEVIGVASAGTVDWRSGTVAFATDNLPGWTGFPIAAYLKAKFGLPVFADNDAYMALAGELFAGAGRGYQNVAMVTIGTGIGGAYALNGKIVRGNGFSAGRWGHTILRAGGIPCNCGARGCAEQYLSGTAFVAGAQAFGKAVRTGREAFELIKRGDRELNEYLSCYLEDLASLLISLQNAVDPDAVILGGGFMDSSDIWWETRFSPLLSGLRMQVLRAKLGNTAGIVGAAMCAGSF